MNTYPGLWKILQSQRIFYKEKPFATYRNSQLEFTELLQNVRLVAGFLHEATRRNLVAIHLENPLDALIGVLGSLVSGKAFWIVDSGILEQNLAIAQAQTFIFDASSYRHAIESQTSFKTDLDFSNPVEESALFCWTTSSGRLASPKITEHTYGSIVGDTLRQINANQITQTDAIDVISPIGFSGSLSSIFPALYSGASLHFLEDTASHSIFKFWQTKGITMSTLIPTTFRALVQFPFDFKELSLRFICLSGEAVKYDDLIRFKERFNKNCMLQVALASSETRAIAEFRFKPSYDLPLEKEISYNTFPEKPLTVVDEQGKPVPQGRKGFIAVTSKMIGSRYINQSGNFYPQQKGFHTFISADRGYILKNGQLVLDQNSREGLLKFKGEYIDLNRIERLILNLPNVYEVHCSLNYERTQLCLFVCSLCSDAELKDFLNKELNLKSYIICNASDPLPKTKSGKLDVKKLWESIEKPAVDVPEDHVLSCLHKSFPQMDDEDLKTGHFFLDLGGDSITAMLFVTQLSQLTGYHLEPSFVYQNSTYPELTEELKNYSSHALKRISDSRETAETILIIPPLYGGILNYSFLIEELKPHYTIYTLRYNVRNQNNYLSLGNIALNAAKYLNSISLSFSKVIGYSISGYLGYHITSQLDYKPHLILIDAPLYRIKNLRSKLKTDSSKIISKIGDFQNKSRRKELLNKAVKILKTHYLKTNVEESEKLPNSTGAFYDIIFKELFQNELKIPITTFPVSLFIATEQNMYQDYIEASYNWEDYSKNLIHKEFLKANHNSVLNTFNAEKIARHILHLNNLKNEPVNG
ncbi:AMP-binding protein [Leeuwenhoekiella parthenopeia]|uniref:AMP-binding protein n=1 Tax=Leeuwenhoekiella parthenopeia TaxID=2890320 RepID=A0ABS8GV83_9FLAO|nr:AMP-binding protein [Leeuwenhoekiella parthenopeia]MCC4213915.1 AMP-binding protein [Leeuwenhoekiella parthenopeia]